MKLQSKETPEATIETDKPSEPIDSSNTMSPIRMIIFKVSARASAPSLGILVIACSLASLAHCTQSAELLNADNRQSTTISNASTSTGKHQLQRDQAASTSGKLSALEAESSTDSIAALAESNFLDSLQSSRHQARVSAAPPTGAGAAPPVQPDEISPAEVNSIQGLKNHLGKTRRQIEQQIKSVDWWTKLAHTKHKQHERTKTSGNRHAKTTSAPSVYREQPLGQNALITIRNQLLAIRDKHRLLMQRSVPQLMQLDAKLIDSYKLCLKKKMPLYAGMLYRTRDHVVRMANDVKHERQVLEAMTKQIQKVLRHKMTNRTLLKDYNRQSSSVASGNLVSALDLSTLKPLQHDYELASGSSSPSTTGNSLVVESDRAGGGAGGAQRRAKRAAAAAASQQSTSILSVAQSAPSASSSSRRTGSSLGKRDSNSLQILPLNEQQPVYDILPVQQQQQQLQKTRQASLLQPIKSNQPTQETGGLDQLTFVQQQHRELSFGDSDEFDSSTSSVASTTSTTTTTSTRRPRPSRAKSYAVHINEINLKKELVKTQALIDRINASSHELMSVADDIIYLFKLTSGAGKGLSASGKTNKFEMNMDQRRVKKVMLKSPFKVLFERYEKLAMTAATQKPSATTTTLSDKSAYMTNDINMMTTSSFLDIDTSDPPEMKPLFDPAEVAVYKDPVDLELGFDSPATLEI